MLAHVAQRFGYRKHIRIAVMGPTGAGKTSFINLASGSQLRVGASLESTTDRIQFSKPFQLDNTLITLIDTPGFDDTTKSDAEILSIIANFLASSYSKKEELHGIIYLHRISDNRMGGTALRNFRMFQQLCGTSALANCVIMLNMWNEVSPEIRSAREEELCKTDIFFKPAIDAGAKVFHHENVAETAQDALRSIARNQPKPLLIQQEIVDQGKPIRDTAAGIALLGELAALEQKQHEQLLDMEREIDEAIRQNDDDERRELEQAQQMVENMRDKLAAEQQKIRTESARARKPSQPKVQRHVKALRLVSTVLFSWITGDRK